MSIIKNHISRIGVIARNFHVEMFRDWGKILEVDSARIAEARA